MKYQRRIEPFGSAPRPVSAISAVGWAAFWSPKVARDVGLMGGWLTGEPVAIRAIAGALPLAVAVIEREEGAALMAPQMVFEASFDYFKSFWEGRKG